jgi:Holliday junction resolvase-like predicted endonuclease|tara:strand:- start:81 stop:419 length:339 start_codon:yes stop_codon:yes gene_type:complete
LKNKRQSSSRKGDLAEYYAVTWLWDNGYEVFPNAGCTGPVDMIATKNGVVTLIDVKTLKRKTVGHGDYLEEINLRPSHTRTKEQIKMGVKILAFNPITRQLRFVEHRDGNSS